MREIKISCSSMEKVIMKNLGFLFIGVVLTMPSYAQTDSVRWMLTSNISSDVFGNVTSGDETFSNMVVRNYNGGVCQKNAPTINGEWPQDAGEISTRFIQFAVSPAENYNFTVTTVKFYIGWAGTTGHMFANVYYSTDSTFSSRTQLGSTITLENTVGVFTTFPLNIVVNDDSTFYVRIYPWDNQAVTMKSCGLYDFGIYGSAVSTVTPSLSSNPSSLSFGSIHVNTSKDKNYLLSGANLAPASGDITVTAPTGFEVSTVNGSGFASSILMSYTGGNLNDTTIYVRFIPSTVAAFNDSIIILGGGATNKVVVTGTAVASDVILGIFVSTTGSDTNSGTFDDPFATITKAVSVAQVGDTIFVRGGTYSLTITITLSASGTDSSNRYYLFAYGSERPVLDFSSMSFGSSNRGIILSGSYWHIKGLDIYKAGDNGMNITGSNNIVEFCELYENRDTGLQLSGIASNNRIINCDSYYNYDDSSSTPGGNADGFSPKQMTGINNYFYGCRAWQNSDDGWDCYEAVASVTLENCWVFASGYLKDGSPSPGNGNGFKLGGNYTENDATLKNCLAFNNASKGFDQNHNRGSMTLINCTGYGNSGYNYAIAEALNPGKTLTLTNCAELGDKRSIGAFAILTTNSWQLFTVTAVDFVSVDTTGVRGARKADGSLPDIDFMHLAQGSQLINAGTNVGLPYNGSAPDLGCFESNWPSGVNDENASIVSEYKLLQNYPNPFNPSTKISYSVGTYSHTSLRVYDLLGREIRTLVDGMRTAGNYNVEWDGKNSAGQEVGTGIYFYQLRCGSGFTATRKMILMK
jgi:hypothetical protein